MNHSIRIVGLLLGLSLSSVLLAADAAVSTTPKLGVLDWQRLVSTAPQAKEAGKRLEAEFQGVAQKLTEKQNDFQAKRTKMQRDKDVVSLAERTKKEKELRGGQQKRQMQQLKLPFSPSLSLSLSTTLTH